MQFPLSNDRTKITNAQFAEFPNAAGAVGPRGEKYFAIDDNIGFRCAR